MSESKKEIFFPNLDTLRFLAFFWVFLQHAFYKAFLPFEQYSYLKRVIDFFFLGGGTGVQIFFVLSGFLITYLIIKEIHETGKLNIGNFYLRRTLRIWPLYYATVLFAFVIYPLLKGMLGIHSDLCSRPFYYFTFLANFDNIHIALNCPGKDAMTQGIVWSVSIEEQFYLLWPVLFYIFPKNRQWFIFPLVIIACIIFRANTSGPALYFHTLAVMGDLAIGGLFAYLSFNSSRFLNFIKELPRRTIMVVYLVIFLLYFFQDKISTFPGNAIFMRLIQDMYWIFIILEQCFAKNALFPLGRIKPFSALGKVSYGLYMLHPVAILIVDISFRVAHINNTKFGMLVLQGILSLIVSIFIAKMSFKWFETPFLRIKERFAVIKTKAV
ncbi:acyltransferase family protein [Chitinophagaceae bacterium MMS25-I14]